MGQSVAILQEELIADCNTLVGEGLKDIARSYKRVEILQHGDALHTYEKLWPAVSNKHQLFLSASWATILQIPRRV